MPRLFREGRKSTRFRLIDAAKKDGPVQRLCRVLGVSPSGPFAWKERPACHRQRTDLMLLALVQAAFAVSKGTYGSPRMVRERRDAGLPIGRRRVARLMRENGMKARQKRRFKRTTDSPPAFPIAPSLLDEGFAASGPNQKRPIGACQDAPVGCEGADISYVWTREGWLYLAVVIDLFARRVVGWVRWSRPSSRPERPNSSHALSSRTVPRQPARSASTATASTTPSGAI
ncbi:putative transposase [Aureimonas pseudogalii]|uniref:Putative transposase n=1 Tax=Aureimonas pseudogalii TaxID=1744844 RepID=A0A7W6H9N9_9HYPH|nr:putative transposase [Aureimonas pseudogalii]